MVQAGQPTPDIVSPPCRQYSTRPANALPRARACSRLRAPAFPKFPVIPLLCLLLAAPLSFQPSSFRFRPGFMASWPHGLMASWPHGLMASWLHGFMASWLHGFMASWLHGFMASWLHGFMASACSGAFASSHQLHTYSPCTGVSWAIHSAPHIAHIPWTNDQQPIVIRPQCEYAISTLVNKH